MAARTLPSVNHYDDTAIRQQLVAGTMDGLMRWCEMTLGQSQREAPNDQGTLEGSGTIIEPDAAGLLTVATTGGRLDALIAYILIYAEYQHEGMRADGTYVIRERPAGGKSKFLEDPVKQNAATLETAIAEGQRRRLR